MAEKFTINCIINNKTCDLKIKSKLLSNTNSFYIYRDGRWLAILRRFEGRNYKAISYLNPLCQLDVDAIGRLIERKLTSSHLSLKNEFDLFNPIYIN
jgi:hypothetical protein